MADVSIVGGGPAGCSAGIFLSKNGFDDVVIYEKFLNKRKVCGGNLGWRVINRYGFLLDGVRLNPIDKWHLDFDGKTFEFCFKKPVCYVSDRLELDRNLRNVAKDWGIRVVNKGVDVNAMDSDIIIDARGFTSSPSPAIAISSICRLKDSKFSLIFRRGSVRSGYFWIFPMDGKTANVGVGCLQKDLKMSLTELFDCFIKELGAKVIEKAAAPISLGGIEKTLGYRNGRGLILKVGEAAGLVNPVIGEGIYHALKSGELAAKALRKSNPLKGYNEMIKKEFSTEFLLSKQSYRLLLSVPTGIGKNVFKFLLSIINYYL